MDSAPLQAIHQSGTHFFITVGHDTVGSSKWPAPEDWTIDKLTAPTTILWNGVFGDVLCHPTNVT